METNGKFTAPRWLIVPLALGMASAHAADTFLGDIAESLPGSGSIHGNAADAIVATCTGLGGAVAGEDDRNALRSACGAMVGSVAALDGIQIPGLSNEFNFDRSNPRDVQNALLQFTGEETSSQGRFATESVDRNFNAIGARLNAIRQGVRAASSLSLNLNGTDLDPSAVAQASQYRTPVVGASAGDANQETGIGWFVNGKYGFGERDNSLNEDEFEYDATNITVGVDYAYANGLVIGGAFSYESTDVDFDNGAGIPQVSGGGIEADGYQISGFAMYSTAAYYLSGIVSYGSHEHDLDRNVVFNTTGRDFASNLRGSTDSDQLAGQFKLGSVIGTGRTTVDVYAGVNWLSLEIDGFAEAGAGAASNGLALTYEDQDIDSVQSVFGARVQGSFSTGNGVILPYAGIEWLHEFDNDARTIDARYRFANTGINTAVGGGTTNNQSFETPTDNPDEDYGVLSIGVAAQLANSLVVFFEYDRTIALKDTEANLITLGVRGIF